MKQALALPAALLLAALSAEAAEKPNIILIYADDLGYGDVGCYGATAVKTPHVDRLATEGLRLTGGYSAAATCTPSRYALMTGEYAFRKKGTGILPGDAAMILPTGRATLPSILRKAGYATGIVGKWHLGLGAGGALIDWNGEIKPGPREAGFAESFIMAATGDRTPCVYIDGGKIAGLSPSDPIAVSYGKPFPGEPTGVSERDRLKMDWSHGHNNAVVNGIGRIGFSRGGKSALWKDEDMADTFNRKGVGFIERHREHPFFLYFATHDIHVPRVPHARFVGTTTMGPRGDAIVQFDACVGELLATLDRLELAANTLVILTSDNGPVLDDGYKDDAVRKLGGHRPAGPLRGGKSSIWEGGTRVPFVVRWPARVKPGVSDAIVSQVDLCSTLAALCGQTLAPDDAPDSINVLPALLGDSPEGREHVLEHAGKVAIRKGPWKFIPGAEKGGKPASTKPAEKGGDALYDLSKDAAETTNLAGQHPEVAEQLSKELEHLRERGRSRD